MESELKEFTRKNASKKMRSGKGENRKGKKEYTDNESSDGAATWPRVAEEWAVHCHPEQSEMGEGECERVCICLALKDKG